eukprot:GHVN01015089.1.p2 GENE.GHVN01015089.1~~GHVN01015089.1.p2  ORF type:complete len:214 (-),score=40.56 GHVN01015089.1:74-715(-)
MDGGTSGIRFPASSSLSRLTSSAKQAGHLCSLLLLTQRVVSVSHRDASVSGSSNRRLLSRYNSSRHCNEAIDTGREPIELNRKSITRAKESSGELKICGSRNDVWHLSASNLCIGLPVLSSVLTAPLSSEMGVDTFAAFNIAGVIFGADLLEIVTIRFKRGVGSGAVDKRLLERLIVGGAMQSPQKNEGEGNRLGLSWIRYGESHSIISTLSM